MQYEQAITKSLDEDYSRIGNNYLLQLKQMEGFKDLPEVDQQAYMKNPKFDSAIKTMQAAQLYATKGNSDADNAKYQMFLRNNNIVVNSKDGKEYFTTPQGQQVEINEKNFNTVMNDLHDSAAKEAYFFAKNNHDTMNIFNDSAAWLARNHTTDFGSEELTRTVYENLYKGGTTQEKMLSTIHLGLDRILEDGKITPQESMALQPQLQMLAQKYGLKTQTTADGQILVAVPSKTNDPNEKLSYQTLKDFKDGWLADNDKITRNYLDAAQGARKAREENMGIQQKIWEKAGMQNMNQGAANQPGQPIKASPAVVAQTDQMFKNGPMSQQLNELASNSGDPDKYKQHLSIAIQQANEVLANMKDNTSSQALERANTVFKSYMKNQAGIPENQIPPIYEQPMLQAQLQEAQAMPDKSKRINPSNASMSIGAQNATEEMRTSRERSIESAKTELANVLKKWGANK